ncbi:MAG: hypothetical protein H5U13_06385 [Parvibaculum sp.]|nr:hypothetical protein [Parvibaculum sp.]
MNSVVSAGAFALAIGMLSAGVADAAEVRLSPADGTEKLVETLIMAEEGDTILLEAGRWNLTDGLVLDADGVTIRGAGAGETVLSFKGQTGSGEGLLVTSDGAARPMRASMSARARTSSSATASRNSMSPVSRSRTATAPMSMATWPATIPAAS